jgi:hypothetical protein
VSALANDAVGSYLNRHFVSGFQKIATFQVNGVEKQGGNVAGYFCLPDGQVLHAIAGPVEAHVFLKEARWVNDTHQLALLEKHTTFSELREFFRKAHLARLASEHHTGVRESHLPQADLSRKGLKLLLDRNRHVQLANQGKVHLLLGVSPLVRVDQLYYVVFESILNEKVSTNPVAVAGR